MLVILGWDFSRIIEARESSLLGAAIRGKETEAGCVDGPGGGRQSGP